MSVLRMSGLNVTPAASSRGNRAHRGSNAPGQNHDQAVDADANAACGGHALADRFDEFFIERACLFIACVAPAGLLFEQFALQFRIVEFGIGVADLLAQDKALKAFDEAMCALFWIAMRVCRGESFRSDGR